MSRFPRCRKVDSSGLVLGTAPRSIAHPPERNQRKMPEKHPISALQTRQMPVGRLTSMRAPRPLVAKLFVLQDLGRVTRSSQQMSPREYNPTVLRLGRPKILLTAVLTAIALLLQSSVAAQSKSLAQYVPTPADVVERMLTLAKVGPSDVV